MVYRFFFYFSAKHYIQFCANGMWVKIGDCVYLRQDNITLPKVSEIIAVVSVRHLLLKRGS